MASGHLTTLGRPSALVMSDFGNYGDGMHISRFLAIASPSAMRVSRHVVSTLPYEVKLKTLFEWPDFGECVSVKVIPPVEHTENNFLENIETRAMIATLSADRSLVEVAGLRDEATEQGANCRVWR